MVRLHYRPHLRIFAGIGIPQKGRDEGKDLCEALFKLAKKLPEKKDNKVAEKRKNLKVQNLKWRIEWTQFG